MSVRFTPDHEWLRLEANGELTVGITDYAQSALGDVVFVQLPEQQKQYRTGQEVVVLESVKAASNITMPLDGEIVAVNDAVEQDPELVNASPMDQGWFFRFLPTDASGLSTLMDESGYQDYLRQQE